MTVKFATTPTLEIAYEVAGPENGMPLCLMHGFPYAPQTYAASVPVLAAKGYRVIVPYLRGYGPTRFRSPKTIRSGEQAALGRDLVDLLDALKIDRAMAAGYDWGGRSACVAAALYPARISGLLTIGGYNIQNIPASVKPAPPSFEHVLWYQYYLHGARGVAGLTADRRAFARYLWRQWSPVWNFDDATFEASAVAFDNPDFVDVVVHSYRHRFGLVAGDPALDADEARLAAQPSITAPTLIISPESGVAPPGMASFNSEKFTALLGVEDWPGIGHNAPQEAPEKLVAALDRLRASIK